MRKRATRGSGLLENFLAKKRARIANSFIPEDCRRGRILDIGCGSFPYFLVSTEFDEKHGLDMAPHYGLPCLNIKRHDLTRSTLPYENEYFDVVTMLAVIEHFDFQTALIIISEIARVLKPGGMFIITTPSPVGNDVLRGMAKLNIVSREEIEEHKSSYSLAQLENVLLQNDFTVARAGTFEFCMNLFACAVRRKRSAHNEYQS